MAVLSVRLTDEQQDRWAARAAERGIDSLSTFVREIVDADVDGKNPPTVGGGVELVPTAVSAVLELARREQTDPSTILVEALTLYAGMDDMTRNVRMHKIIRDRRGPVMQATAYAYGARHGAPWADPDRVDEDEDDVEPDAVSTTAPAA